MAKVFQVDSGGTLTTGLLSYYQLEDATDYYGTKDGTAVGTVNFNAGKVNNAMDTNNANYPGNYIQMGDNFGFERTDSFSIAGWFKTSVTNLDKAMWGKMTSSIGYFVRSTYSVNYYVQAVYGNIGGNFINKIGGTNLSSGTAYHVAVTYSGNSDHTGIKIYVNGTEETYGTDTGTMTTTMTCADNFALGYESFDGSTNTLKGWMDEVGIWSKVLTGTEITDLYNGGSGQTMIVQSATFIPQITVL